MTSKEKTKSLINKATTDDRNPPSGYLLKELSSRTMSIQECQLIEDLVVKKLGKNKPYIKYKSLRIVKFLCENGSPNWRRAWQRNTDKLRDAQQFRGPPDPIYGDAPYQQVRKAAKDAMQAVFQQSTIDSSHIKQRIKGMDGGGGSSSWSSSQPTASSFGSGSRGVYGGTSIHKKDKAPSVPSASWGKQMPGHGNTSYQPQVRTTTFEPLKSSQRYTNPAVLSGKNIHSSGRLDARRSGKRKKGKAGGVWGGGAGGDEEEEEEEEEEDYSNQYVEEFASSDHYEKPKSKRSFGGNIKKKSKASSGQYERRWVDDIVKSGGVGCKIHGLDKFVKQFENLSKNHVLEYLDEKLEDSAWQKQGKAVTLIDALCKGHSSDDVIDYFSQSPENLKALINAKKSIIRRKVNKVIEYLELSEEEEETEEEEEEEEKSIHQMLPKLDKKISMKAMMAVNLDAKPMERNTVRAKSVQFTPFTEKELQFIMGNSDIDDSYKDSLENKERMEHSDEDYVYTTTDDESDRDCLESMTNASYYHRVRRTTCTETRYIVDDDDDEDY
eukprot:750992_1